MEYGCLYGLKGQKRPAQGSALGMLRTTYCALQGQKHCCQRVKLLPLQGALLPVWLYPGRYPGL